MVLWIFILIQKRLKKTGAIRNRSEIDIGKNKQHALKKGRYTINKKQSKINHWLSVPTSDDRKMLIDTSDKENKEGPLKNANSSNEDPYEPFLPFSQDMCYPELPKNVLETDLDKANMKITSLKMIIEEKDKEIRELKSVLRKIIGDIPEEYHPTLNEFSLYL